MTQDNAPTGSPSDPRNPTPGSPGDKAAGPAAPAPRRKRHWFRRIFLGLLTLVVLLLVLVGLAPTILSTAAARNFVLSKVNERLNGHVTATGWSISWTGGIRADDLKVFDDQNRQILQIPRFSTQLSLLSAMRGQFHLGNTTVEGLDFLAERDKEGKLNFAKLVKEQPAAEKPAAPAPQPSQTAPSKPAKGKLPSLDGELHLVNCRGTYVDDNSPRPVIFSTIAGDVKIPSINSPIEDSLKVVAQIEGREVTSFSTDGKLQVASNNELLDPDKMIVQQKFTGNVQEIDPVLSLLGYSRKLADEQLAFRGGALGLSGNVDADGQRATVAINLTATKVTLEKGTGPTAKKVLDNYTLNVGTDASYSASGGTTHISVTRLGVTEEPASPNAMVNVQLTGNKPIQIDSASDGKMQGSGAVDLGMNLARINDVVRAFNSGAEVAATTPEGARLTSGLLNGSVSFGSDQQQLAVDGNFNVTALTVAVPDAAGLKNEQVALAFSLRAAQNFATADIPKADITGSVLTLNASDVRLTLKDAAGKSLPPMQMLKHAMLVVNIPALEKLQALEDSFAPAPGKSGKPGNVAMASTDPEAAQWALAKAAEAPAKPADAPAAPIKLAKGSLLSKVEVVGDAYGSTAALSVQGAGIQLTRDNVPDDIGDLIMDGRVAVGGGASSVVSTVMFNNLRAQAVGSAVVLNGTLDDLEHTRSFKNVTADLTYNATKLWNALLPLLSKEQQAKLKDTKVSGNYTRRFTVNGTYPADKASNEAIASLVADGELVLDLFDGQGATLKGLVIPIWLEGGKLRIAYKGKPAGQEYAAAAQLNGGAFSLAGATIDLSAAHTTLTIPDGTKLLENVSINPLFAKTFLAGWISNPVFAGANKAAGSLFVTVKHCNQLPVDALVLENLPENKGVLDMNIAMTHVEVGSQLINGLNSALALINPRGKIASGGLLIEIPTFLVHIEHGITSEDMKLEIGKNPPVQLAGTVVMKTNALQMTASIPVTRDQSVKLPVTGTVDDPKLDTGGVLQQNLKMIPGLPNEVKDLLGGAQNKGGATQPADKNAVEDLLGNVFKPKDKKKDAGGK